MTKAEIETIRRAIVGLRAVVCDADGQNYREPGYAQAAQAALDILDRTIPREYAAIDTSYPVYPRDAGA